jgi:tetratricopeptide (TPR) repeat protein
VREAAGEPEIVGWLERAERLAIATDRYSELVALEREILSQILDEEVQLSTSLRIGELARGKLGDRDLARTHYQKALEIRGDDRRALSALESLYEEANDGPALLDILKRRVDAAETDAEKKDLLFRQGKLCAGPLGDPDAAITVYETILDLSMDPEAISLLEGLYRTKERWQDLIALYERQLEAGAKDRSDLFVKIAVIARQNMSDVQRAFDELEAALERQPARGRDHEPETLLRRGKAAPGAGRRTSSPAPEARQLPGLMATRGGRPKRAPDERRPLLKRLANLRKSKPRTTRGSRDHPPSPSRRHRRGDHPPFEPRQGCRR